MAIREIRCLDWQADAHEWNDLMAGVVGGLGAGKTKWAADWFIDRCKMYPRANNCIAGIDLPQLKRGTLMSLRGALEERNEPYSYNRSEGTITLKKYNSTVIPLTAENYQSWRSLEADTIWADELADWGPQGEEAFLKYLLPRRRLSPVGKKYAEKDPTMRALLRFTTNPPLSTTHWVYEWLVTRRGCRFINVSTRENYLMPYHEDYVKGLEATFSPDLWSILIDGNFGNAMMGAVYKGFSRPLHCPDYDRIPAALPRMGLTPGLPIVWTLDFNVAYMCSVIAQVHTQRMVPDGAAPLSSKVVPFATSPKVKPELDDYQRRVFYAIDEIVIPDAGVPDVINEFLKRYGKVAREVGVYLYGDSAGGARSQSIDSAQAARSNWELIIEALTAAKIPIQWRVLSHNPSVMDRVNAVKARLRTGAGVGMLMDVNKCPILARDFETVKWREGTNDIDKRDAVKGVNVTHISDAWGYFAYVENALERQLPLNFLSFMER